MVMHNYFILMNIKKVNGTKKLRSPKVDLSNAHTLTVTEWSKSKKA